jgi:mono/diheme cytochrome c family protein
MRQSRNVKVVILVSSVLTIVLLSIAIIQENISVEWKDYQKAYRELLLAGAVTDKGKDAADIAIKLRQEFLPELNRIDRCSACHIGIDNPKMIDAEQPITAHSGDILKHHPLSEFGCTVCHDGQGLATVEADAHGEVAFWPYPLLRGDRVYTSCGRCHYENDLYGAEYDLFTTGTSLPPLLRDELESSVPGSQAIARGKMLVLSSGCLGCHTYRSRGGTLGPDITYIGDKSAHDFDFTHVEGNHTVDQWLFEHFLNPDRLSPGTLMPDMNLTDPQAHDLTQYMLSLHRKRAPASHTPAAPRRKDDPVSGSRLYTMFCNACHGQYGQGSTVRDPLMAAAADVPSELMVPSLNNPDTLAMASDDYLRSIIAQGRPDTTMISWGAPTGGGLHPEETDRLVAFIRSWEPPRPDMNAIAASRGDERFGRAFYERNCAACHGTRGEGGIGTTLNSPSFLAIASDEFLAQALIEGRLNTAMPSWKQFDSQQISDLIAYIRTWHPARNDKQTVLKKVSAAGSTPSVSESIGKTIYKTNCVMCHGPSGEGDLAPSIATQEFLTVVDNAFLYDTLALGRPGTGMPAWRHFSSEDMASLIVFMRTWQKTKTRILPSIPIKGDWDTGKLLYQRLCLSCHGAHAEGGVGPQLNNPVFLETASDAMLYAWIANGKRGTPMRSFLKGGQGMVELDPGQIRDVVSHIRSLERQPRVSIMRSPNGRPELGQLWYATMCASCHGEKGQGASGPSLANPGFLRAASDGFLMATMALGRDGTEMRPVKKSPQSILSLSSDEVNDLVAYLRSWEIIPPSDEIPHNFVIPWDLKHGKRLYVSNCSGCHGINGRAEIYEPGISAWAPALNNEGFLAAATDGFLQATIVRGRTGTAMQPFGYGHQGLVDLSKDEVDDLVAYIRRWSTQT